MGSIYVREEAPADHLQISELVRAAFDSEVEVRLVEAIRRADGYLPHLSLVAENESGRVVGHVMVSHARLVHRGDERPVATLSPLAVAPDHQHRGIGSELVRVVTARAEAIGEPVVVLEGSPIYYRRFGFEPASSLGIVIDLPDWAPPEAAQVLRLATYSPDVRGQLIFDALAEAEPDQR